MCLSGFSGKPPQPAYSSMDGERLRSATTMTLVRHDKAVSGYSHLQAPPAPPAPARCLSRISFSRCHTAHASSPGRTGHGPRSGVRLLSGAEMTSLDRDGTSPAGYGGFPAGRRRAAPAEVGSPPDGQRRRHRKRRVWGLLSVAARPTPAHVSSSPLSLLSRHFPQSIPARSDRSDRAAIGGSRRRASAALSDARGEAQRGIDRVVRSIAAGRL